MTLKDADGKLTWLVGRFARITTSGKIMPEIDGLRFLAISAVIMVHSFEQVAAKNQCSIEPASYHGVERLLVWLFGEGFYGVHLFFVISGFILGLQFAEKNARGLAPPSVKSFYLRRVTRLEPPYIVSMVLFYFLAAYLAVHGLLKTGLGYGALVPHLVASLCYLHNAVFRRPSVVNPVAWSLEVEVQFYLLMPMVANLIYRLQNWKVRGAILCAAVIIAGVVNDRLARDSWIHNYTIVGFAGYFLMGVLLSEMYTCGLQSDVGRIIWDALGGFCLIVFIISRVFVAFEWHYPICLGLISWAGLRGRLLSRMLKAPPIWLVGGMCYSIYLYHYWILSILARVGTAVYVKSWPVYLNLLIVLIPFGAIVLAVAGSMFVYVERPCMERQWPKRLWAVVVSRGSWFKRSSAGG